MAAQKNPKTHPTHIDPALLRLIANVRVSPVDPEEQAEFEESVKTHGVMQPLTVRYGADGVIEVVAGQRRFNAAMKHKLSAVPIHFRAIDDDHVRTEQLLENIDRSSMTAIDIACAVWDIYNNEAAGSQQVIADMLSKPKSWVSKMMKLGADLPDSANTVARDLMLNGHMADADMGKYLCHIEELSLEDAKRIGKEIAENHVDPEKGVAHTRKTLKTALDQIRAGMDPNGEGDGEEGEEDGGTDGGVEEKAAPVSPTYTITPEDYRMLAHLLREGTVPAKWLERKAAMLHFVEAKLADHAAESAD